MPDTTEPTALLATLQPIVSLTDVRTATDGRVRRVETESAAPAQRLCDQAVNAVDIDGTRSTTSSWTTCSGADGRACVG